MNDIMIEAIAQLQFTKKEKEVEIVEHEIQFASIEFVYRVDGEIFNYNQRMFTANTWHKWKHNKLQIAYSILGKYILQIFPIRQRKNWLNKKI